MPLRKPSPVPPGRCPGVPAVQGWGAALCCRAGRQSRAVTAGKAPMEPRAGSDTSTDTCSSFTGCHLNPQRPTMPWALDRELRPTRTLEGGGPQPQLALRGRPHWVSQCDPSLVLSLQIGAGVGASPRFISGRTCSMLLAARARGLQALPSGRAGTFHLYPDGLCLESLLHNDGETWASSPYMHEQGTGGWGCYTTLCAVKMRGLHA